MGKELAENYPEAARVFEAADEALGFPLSALCFEGPEEELKLTENTQPAILTASVAACAVLTASGLKPSVVAGHSLGEYSALVAAGALDFVDAVKLVRKRGRYMQEAVPRGEGAMAAILGMPRDAVEELCRDSAQGLVVQAANLNGAGQIVIAGHTEAVERACGLAKERGARRAVSLPVSAPFHCSLMEPAALRLDADLAETPFFDFETPLYANVDARPISEATLVREALSRQVTAPVRWQEIIENMARDGVERFIEVGPGRVLTGLVKKIVKGADAASVGAPQAVQQLVEAGVV